MFVIFSFLTQLCGLFVALLVLGVVINNSHPQPTRNLLQIPAHVFPTFTVGRTLQYLLHRKQGERFFGLAATRLSHRFGFS
jgi:hypothetical protein